MYEKQKHFLVRAACWATAASLLWLCLRYLLGWLLPFLLALGIAALVDPAIEAVRRRMHLRRVFLSAVFTLLLFSAAAALVATLLKHLLRQANEALQRLPAYLTGLPALADSIFRRLESFSASCPAGLREDMEQLVARLPEQFSALAGDFSAAGLRFLASLAASLPQAGLFCVTTALAMFFSVSTYPAIAAFVRRQLSPAGQTWAKGLRNHLFSTLGKWLKAQCILLTLTFFQLLVGFLLLRQPYALLLAVTVALIDALPVFGTGTVLLPWSALLLLAGNVPRSLALAALYAVIAFVRSVTEPRIMAAQAGLPPLPALVAMYAGFRALGVGGMILCPIALLLLKQLHDAGYLKLWK
ncbi:MAG: sporulation integral membrane protein YtvI [Ruminococcaceae bacterium]|nr:sporulation integral membrane protein YtvI [Oscillospiraceae bacterium]